MAEPHAPFVLPLAGPGPHLPLLTADNARRMRAGLVTLAPGASSGRHSTEGYEELLVVLAGRAEVEVEGHGPLAAAAPAAVYIPPRTFHNVVNPGPGEARYVYSVAPTAAPETDTQ